MKRAPPRRAFVTNELLIVIALLAIWLAAAIPVYARIIQRLTELGKPIGLVQQLQTLGIAAVGGALFLVVLFALLGGLIWVGEQTWGRLNGRHK